MNHLQSRGRATLFRAVLVTSFMSALFTVQAQKRNFNWVFASGVWLQFTHDTIVSVPLADTVSLRNASISDTEGQFRLLADDFGIRNALFQLVQGGGAAELGWNVPAANYLILPIPGPGERYAVFIIEEPPNARAGWVEVDLSGGSAGVVVGNTTWFMQHVTAKLTATTTLDENGYWVLLHGEADDAFHAFHLGPSGFDTVPVISHQGTVYLPSAPERNMDRYGKMNFSFQGDRLAVVKNDTSLDTNKVEIFDFDRATGALVHWADIRLQDYGGDSASMAVMMYPHLLNVDFDLTGRYLYAENRMPGITLGRCFQFDLEWGPVDLVYSRMGFVALQDEEGRYDNQYGSLMAMAPAGWVHAFGPLGLPQSGTVIFRQPIFPENYAQPLMTQTIQQVYLPWQSVDVFPELLLFGYQLRHLQGTPALGGFPSPCKRYTDSSPLPVQLTEMAPVQMIGVWPNPMASRAVLSFDQSVPSAALQPEQVIWRDLLGRELGRSVVKRLGPSFALERGNIPAGLYLVEVQAKDFFLGTVKVVCE